MPPTLSRSETRLREVSRRRPDLNHVGRERRPIGIGQLAVLGHGETITAWAAAGQESRHPTPDVALLGGKPIREPMAWSDPFVMNTRTEVVQAMEDHRKGRLGTIQMVRMPHGDLGRDRG